MTVRGETGHFRFRLYLRYLLGKRKNMSEREKKRERERDERKNNKAYFDQFVKNSVRICKIKINSLFLQKRKTSEYFYTN